MLHVLYGVVCGTRTYKHAVWSSRVRLGPEWVDHLTPPCYLPYNRTLLWFLPSWRDSLLGRSRISTVAACVGVWSHKARCELTSQIEWSWQKWRMKRQQGCVKGTSRGYTMGHRVYGQHGPKIFYFWANVCFLGAPPPKSGSYVYFVRAHRHEC